MIIKAAILWLKKKVRNLIWRFWRKIHRANFKRALQLAEDEANRTGRTQLVCWMGDEYRVYEKSFLKSLRAKGKAFRGYSNQDIENLSDIKIYKHVAPRKKAS